MGRPKKNQGSSSSYVPKKIQSLEGLEDITADTDMLWSAVLNRLARFSRVYGFEKVETPLLEDFRLYENFYKHSPLDLAAGSAYGYWRETGGGTGRLTAFAA